MSRNFASFKTTCLRRAAMAGALAVVAATAFAGSVAPAAAFGFHHGGFGGFHHNGFAGFHRRLAFAGPGFFAGGYDESYAGYDECLRRVWGPYGWRVINLCD